MPNVIRTCPDVMHCEFLTWSLCALAMFLCAKFSGDLAGYLLKSHNTHLGYGSAFAGGVFITLLVQLLYPAIKLVDTMYPLSLVFAILGYLTSLLISQLRTRQLANAYQQVSQKDPYDTSDEDELEFTPPLIRGESMTTMAAYGTVCLLSCLDAASFGSMQPADWSLFGSLCFQNSAVGLALTISFRRLLPEGPFHQQPGNKEVGILVLVYALMSPLGVFLGFTIKNFHPYRWGPLAVLLAFLAGCMMIASNELLTSRADHYSLPDQLDLTYRLTVSRIALSALGVTVIAACSYWINASM